MGQQHYCKILGCLATYPCSIHPDIQEEKVNDYFEHRPTEVKVTELPIRVIFVMPLPCSHNYPVPEDEKKRKKFHAICGYCDSEFEIELKRNVYEITRTK